MPYNDDDKIRKSTPEYLKLGERDLKESLTFLGSGGGDSDKVKDKKKPGFNTQAFKHAISMIESSGGKFLENKYSSAAGKYHFLYNSIKNDPSMKGISKREFINRPDLQELIMDKAIAGDLDGYTYGSKYATKLKSQYKTDHDVNEITALVHFLGAGNVRKYLKNPGSFQVAGKVNATPQKYASMFSKHFSTYKGKKKERDNLLSPEIDGNIGDESNYTTPKEMEAKNLIQPKDNTAVAGRYFKDLPEIKPEQNTSVAQQNIYAPEQKDRMRELLSQLPTEVDEFQSRQGELNQFREGGEIGSRSNASDLVTLFEAGGSHSQNPNGGIPQGIGSNGKPNLVEEGETKWNDYVFSNVYDMEGNFTGKDGKKSNVFEKGGNLNCGGPGQPPCEREKLTAKEEKSVMDYIDNQDKESAMQQMRDRADSQSMRASDPEATFVDKAFNVLANPMSAMTKGNSAVNLNVNMENRNPFDDILDTINPFAWGQYASESKDSFDKEDYVGAGFNALGAIPIVPAWAAKGKKVLPSIKKGITKSGKKSIIKSHELGPDLSDITDLGSTIDEGIIPRNPRSGNSLVDLFSSMTGGGKKELEKLRPLILELAEGSKTAREVFDLTLTNLKSPQGQKRLLEESLDIIKSINNSGDGLLSMKEMTSMAKKEVKQKMKKFESSKNVNETLAGATKGNTINKRKAFDGIYNQANGDTSLIDNAAANAYRNTWWLGTNATKSKPTAAHELQHMLQDGSRTNLDKELQKLPQLHSSDVGNQNYFNKGSKGMEARAFASELRQSMLDRGILKNKNGTWGEITEDMLNESVTSFKNKPAGKMYSGDNFGSSTRILDIVDPKGFKDLAKLMNKLTGAVAPVAIAASQLSDDNKLRLGGLTNTYKEGGKIDNDNSPSPKNKVTKKSKPKTKENFDNYKLS